MSGGSAGADGVAQGPGNAYARAGNGQQSSGFGPGVNNFGGGMGNASAQPYNPTGGAPNQTTTPTNAGAAMSTMFGALGQPAGNASAPQTQSPLQAPEQTQPFGMQPMQSPFQAPQQPQQNIGIGDFMQQQMDAQRGMQPGMQPQTQSNPAASLAALLRGQGQQGTEQLGLLPPTQTGQPMPPSFGRQLGADEQAPNPYMQDRLRSLLPPMQTPFQMPEGGGQLGPNPYQVQSPYPGPGKFNQPFQGGIAGLPAMQPQSKQQMKEQMRQQQRMGPAPRVRPGGQPQQMYAEPQQYMY